MECGICLEDKILKKDIVFFRCSHNICKECCDKLLKRLCPFCRRKIRILSTIQDHIPNKYIEDEEEEYYNYIYTDDFIVPRLRPDHQEYRRQKKESKKIKLQTFLNMNDNWINSKLIPSIKKKRNKKLILFLI